MCNNAAMQISLSKSIAAAPDKVWAIITDLDRAGDAISGIIKTERLDDGTGFGVGTRWRETRRMFGKEATEEMEVSAFDPQRSYTVTADSHSAHYVSTWSVVPDGEGTSLSMTFAGVPQGLFGKVMAATLGRLMVGSTRKALQKDLDEIAEAVEG